jgi:predicted nucleic acid-binding protein
MVCFDTNIVIYLANGTIGEDIIGNEPILYPSIVRIESLGYSNIKSIEEQKIRDLLATLTEVPLTYMVIERAIKLRQNMKMSLGDSIVAATALENNCSLLTANVDDFSHIDDLKVLSPF